MNNNNKVIINNNKFIKHLNYKIFLGAVYIKIEENYEKNFQICYNKILSKTTQTKKVSKAALKSINIKKVISCLSMLASRCLIIEN